MDPKSHGPKQIQAAQFRGSLPPSQVLWVQKQAIQTAFRPKGLALWPQSASPQRSQELDRT